MSKPGANCPSCGAPVAFRFSSSVQTTCDYCHSIVVRTDVDMQKVGTVADLPPNASPIRIGTEGIVSNKAFVVAGRIIYEYEQGNWNEWHLVFNDGTSGWLSDAQLEYDVSFAAANRQALPPADQLMPGQIVGLEGTAYAVTSITKAHYRGVEGELPFQYWDKTDVMFADLRTGTGQFGTLDYSEEPPMLFLGYSTDFDSLKLKNLRSFEGWD
jgi:hypothetical protein